MPRFGNFVSNNEAVGYIRTSILDQESSVNIQQKEIERTCDYKNVKLIKVYSDIGISGDNMERPQLLQMLSDIKSGTLIIVYDLQRLSKNTENACFIYGTIKNKGCRLVCKNPEIDFSSIYGEFIYEILISFGKFQRAMSEDKFITV